jgi:hypothetical protein
VLRDASTFATVWEASDPGYVTFGDVAFSPDGRTIAWGVYGIALVDAATACNGLSFDSAPE